MSKEPAVFLRHVLESIEQIEEYLAGVSEVEFLRSTEKQDAVTRQIEVIGEAMRNILEDFKDAHPEIPWYKAMGARNILIHEYFGVDLNLIWTTATQFIPELKKHIEDLLHEPAAPW